MEQEENSTNNNKNEDAASAVDGGKKKKRKSGTKKKTYSQEQLSKIMGRNPGRYKKWKQSAANTIETKKGEKKTRRNSKSTCSFEEGAKACNNGWLRKLQKAREANQASFMFETKKGGMLTYTRRTTKRGLVYYSAKAVPKKKATHKRFS